MSCGSFVWMSLTGEDVLFHSPSDESELWDCVVLVVCILVHLLVFLGIAKGLERPVLREFGGVRRSAIFDKKLWIVRLSRRFIRVSRVYHEAREGRQLVSEEPSFSSMGAWG